jgi:hypothetical protein
VPTAPTFKFVSIRRDALGGVRVDWLSAANTVYALQRTSNLKTGFVDIATGLAATPPQNSYRDASATASAPYFYRLRIDNGVVVTPLKFTRIAADAQGGLRLDWLSATDKAYTLERSTNLAAGFMNLQTGIAATPPTNSYRDSTATGRGPFFYRLRLEQ